MAFCKSLFSGVLVLVFLSAVVTAFSVGRGNYTFYDRAAWGAQEVSDGQKLNLPVPYVVIHHTYIPAACHSFEECSKSMRAMQNYHISKNYGDIGYNFCVGAEGSVYEGRGWYTMGAHAYGANRFSIGICLIGDWREELPPAESLAATKALISEGINLGVISQNYKLVGHQQANPTECPGKALMEEIETWPHYQPGHINLTSIVLF